MRFGGNIFSGKINVKYSTKIHLFNLHSDKFNFIQMKEKYTIKRISKKIMLH